MNEHTPGPWYMQPPKRAIQFNCDYAIKTADNLLLAEVFEQVGKTTFVNAQHNARLIAAAPDLLAACEEWEQGLIEDDFDMRVRGIKAMRAAVAKAKGVQS